MPRTNVIVQMRPNRCRYCDVGWYALRYTLEYAQARGVDVTDLEGNLATKAQLESALQSKDPAFFNGFGHGSESTYTAQDTLPVLVACSNDQVMAGRVCYLLSCKTAVTLGPSMVNKGAACYMGYAISWTWMDQDGAGDPYNDKYARGFYESSNAIPMALLDGGTTGQSRDAGIAKYKEWIEYWKASTDRYAAEAVKWLTYDMNGLRLIGSETTRVVSAVRAAGVSLVPIASLITAAAIGSIPKRRRNQIIAFSSSLLASFGLGLLVERQLGGATITLKRLRARRFRRRR